MVKRSKLLLKRGKQLGIKPASENPRDFFEIAPVLIGLAPPIRSGLAQFQKNPVDSLMRV
jgi:hypothetical protein